MNLLVKNKFVFKTLKKTELEVYQNALTSFLIKQLTQSNLQKCNQEI